MISERVLIQLDEVFLPDIRKKVAELPSPYSNNSGGQISRKISKSSQALLLIFISTFRDYWETDLIIRAIGQKAYQCNYSGKWREVQEYLELYQPNPLWFIEKYLESHTTQQLFGNFLRETKRELKVVKIKSEEPRLTPKKSQRKRGYDDKGSLRLPHEYHGERPLKEKQDRRKLHNHPLLNDFTQGEILWDEKTSRKEEST